MTHNYEAPIERLPPKTRFWIFNNPINGYFQCKLPIIHETEKAICFDNSTDPEVQVPVWIPKSQMQFVFLPEINSRKIFVKAWLSDHFTKVVANN